jgi:predicted membrane channel-forming protein YqfA (hemolysin III family)
VALLIIGYFVFHGDEPMHGGSPAGLLYGTLGLGLIMVLMYFGVRKRSYKSSWGSVEAWLHAHIYLGLAAVAVVLLHSGFRFHNVMAITALVLFVLVSLSGIWGAVLYTVIPPRLSLAKGNLTTLEISEQINDLGASMARLATGKSESFREICVELLNAEKPQNLAGWRCLARGYLERRLAQDPAGAFERYVGRVASDEQAELTQLLALAHQRNDLHDSLIRCQRYLNVMEAWLYLHVPFSFVMLLALAAHVAGYFYYG